MSSPAVGGVAGVGVVVSAAFVSVAVVSARSADVDGADLAMTPGEFARFAVASFGALGLVTAVAIAVATTVGDLSPATVGFGSTETTPTAAAVGGLLGLGAYAFHHLLKRALRTFGLPFTELFEEMVPGDWSGLGYYALGYLVSTTTEELVFRATLVGAGAAALGLSEWYLIVPAAVVFGVAHTGRGSGSVVSSSAMGVLFGVVFVEFGLVAAVACHAVNNTTAAALAAWRTPEAISARDATAD